MRKDLSFDDKVRMSQSITSAELFEHEWDKQQVKESMTMEVSVIVIFRRNSSKVSICSLCMLFTKCVLTSFWLSTLSKQANSTKFHNVYFN